jgi:hypothetical protein
LLDAVEQFATVILVKNFEFGAAAGGRNLAVLSRKYWSRHASLG